MTIFLLATRNPHKIAEIQAILSDFPITLKSLRDFPDSLLVDETGKTYEDNALLKAKAAAIKFKLPSLADDSGLEVDALGGEPGIYSSRYLGEDTDYTKKNSHMVNLLKDIPMEKRTARFVCAAALALPDGACHVVRETIEGRIAFDSKGAAGFGYDPIFFVPSLGRTLAEIPSAEKNKISHRGKAFRKLMELARGD